ncbi:alcohol oxidase [Obba rivulosa]|uniref:Alcohol oxidase n=1 Tax=Obba rivulosa TaxID=1052685 RepID=A0A8E2J2B4_9APHY|nr:alcohol oxidase [Obba rivulosa]
MTANIADVSGKEFDYIIVGGGTCGLVLAARLSEDSSVKVLVLEAGEANLDDPILLLPGQRAKQLGNPKYDWAFKTVNQVHSNDRAYAWPRGKGLGGSSAINFQLWNKPAREYLDALTELGNPGWDWESFDKYSKKAERFVKPDHDLEILTYDPAHRGESGPLLTSFPLLISNIERPAIEALKKHGVEKVLDSSSGYTDGVSPISSTVDPSTHYRSYSANMYYQPVASRSNLTVLVSAQVARIVSKKNADGTLTATGVSFFHSGETHQVKATKEVILSAGTIMSPQILELSGIGDRGVLEKAGVEVQIELPGVGANVQEHLYSGVTYEVTSPSVDGREILTFDPLIYPDEAAKHFELLSSGQGVLNLMTVGLVFLPLDTVCADADKIRQTLAHTIQAGLANNAYPSGLRKQYELQLRHLKEKVPSLEIAIGPGPVSRPTVLDPKKKHLSLVFALNTPFSRGTIHISSNDPLAHPTIDPRVFEEEYDLNSLVETVKFNRRLAKTEPLKSILAEEEMYPGPQVETDEQIAEWLRNSIGTTYHTVGSCSMLPLEDGGVVDPKLKVYNTTNIRVADLSIIPLQVGSHTQALAYAVGEQAADIIKGNA